MNDENRPASGLRAIAADPTALLPLAALAIVVVGVLHLISDIVAFSGSSIEQLGGIITDSHTVVTGLALVVGLTAVAATPLPGTVADWKVLSWVARVQSDPGAVMPRAIGILLAVGVVQTVVAAWNARDRGTTFALTLLSHDLFYVITIAAVVILLTTVAVSRTGSVWNRAADARQALTVALSAAPFFGVLLTVFWMVEQAGDDTRTALVMSSFALLQTVAAVAVLLVANVIVRSLHPEDPETHDRFALRGPARRLLDDPSAAMRPMVPICVAIGVLHVLLAVGRGGQVSAGYGWRAFADSAFDVAAIVAAVVLLRAAARRYGAMNVLAMERPPQRNGADIGRTLQLAVYVVGALGIFSALVSFWVIEGDSWVALYYLFNRLVRTAIVLGVLVGLQALHGRREPMSA